MSAQDNPRYDNLLDLLAQVVGKWPCEWQVGIESDSFHLWTVTLWRWNQRPPFERWEIGHVHMDDLFSALEWALEAKQEALDAHAR